ncbi:NTP transferase domain-containing protein [bacterium]|nr:NTP transferase domain-containing protein [bacterium]
MRGIVLAGGAGTRLRPLTSITSKQLLPVYNKPMVFYPIQTLVDAGIKEILIIIAPKNAGDFLNLLGDGEKFGVKFSYVVQPQPAGLAQAFIIGERFIGDDDVTMVLGDNLFEYNFSDDIKSFRSGGRVFAKQVKDPERFGVVAFNKNGKVTSIEEKPEQPKSNYAIPGLYIYDNSVIQKAKKLQPSARGELEIVDLHKAYLKEGSLDVRVISGRWYDCGTFESLFEATDFVRARARGKKPLLTLADEAKKE